MPLILKHPPPIFVSSTCLYTSVWLQELGKVSQFGHNLGQIIFCWGLSWTFRMFRNIPGLYPLDTGSTTPPGVTPECHQALPSVPCWQILRGLEPLE